MRGYRIRVLLLPLLLAAGLTACASNGVPPGIVYTSSAPAVRAGGHPWQCPLQLACPAGACRRTRPPKAATYAAGRDRR